MSASFFPKISRCNKYDVKADGTNYVYSHYMPQVVLDCQQRCVYCDVTVTEIGHEGFHLDHFRPQEKFPHLANSPQNLVAACPKCNRWKSSHWPLDVSSMDSHDGKIGFIEPFQNDRLEFFSVASDGKLSALKGPSEYAIALLHLNRPSRVIVRKNRLLSCKIDKLLDIASEAIQEATALLKSGSYIEEAIAKLSFAQTAVDEIKEIKNFLQGI